MYGKIAYGTFGSFIVKFAILLSNFTSCCAFFKIFGKVAKAIVGIFVEKDSYFINNERNHFYVLLLFICMLPLIFKKSIDAFRVNSNYNKRITSHFNLYFKFLEFFFPGGDRDFHILLISFSVIYSRNR